MMRRSTPLTLAAAVTAALTAGCAVGPDYVRPTPALAPQWSTPLPAATATAPDTLVQWWRQIDDPVLTALIERALDANRDVREAIARIREARALQAVVDARARPQVGLSGSAARDRLSENGRIPLIGIQNPANVYQAGFDASWELDVFGGIRRAREAAAADVGRVELDRESVAISVSAEVAVTYLRLRGAQAQLRTLDQQITVARETISIVGSRLKAGLVSDFDLLRAQELLAILEARRPVLDAEAGVEMRRLGVLVGDQSGSLVATLSPQRSLPSAIPQLPAEVPAGLLARRADLRSIERSLAAENARVGVEEANKYPQLSLGLSLGLLSLATGNFFSAASAAWNVGASFSAPIYQGGALNAKVAAAQARYEQAAIRYDHAAARAVEEVESAALRYQSARERQTKLLQALAADEDILRLAVVRYGSGLTDFLTVLDAQRQLFTIQDEEIAARERALAQLVALYKALGGGWDPARVALTSR